MTLEESRYSDNVRLMKTNVSLGAMTIIFFISALLTRSSCDFAADANALISNQKTVRLDPILRRALLKALTELEEEAQKKAREEEEATRAAANEKLQTTAEILASEQSATAEEARNDEIQNTADSTYPTPSPITPQETIPPTPEVTPPPVAVEETTQHVELLQTNPPITIKDTFFFQTPSPLESDKAKLQAAPILDIESNLITDDKEVKQEKKEKPTPTEIPQTPAPTVKVSSSDSEVDIFKAPLVAAFTLHQDSKGTPQSIIPLFKNQNQFIQQQQPLQQQVFQQEIQQQQFQPQTQFFIQPSQLSGAFTFGQNQALQSAQQFAVQNQFQSSSLGFAPQQFQPSQGPFGVQQNFNQFDVTSGQQQLPSAQAPPLFQQQAISSVTVTPQSQPHNLNSNNFNFNNFPSSTAFPPVSSNSIAITQSFPSSTPNPISSTVRPVSGFPSSTPQTTFTIPPVTLPLQNERFQSPIVVQQPSQQTQTQNQFFLDEQVRQRQLAEQNRLRQLEEQARFRQLEQLNRQREIEEERLRNLAGQGPDQFRAQRQQPNLHFQRSLGFTFSNNPFQFQQTHSRINRQEGFGQTGNFGFNQPYRTIPDEVYRQRNFRSPQQQLAQLLYQSGVTTDSNGHEELNIVSKVLALNHERSDANLEDAKRSSLKKLSPPSTSDSGFSQPIVAGGFIPISRSDVSVDGAKSERRQDDTTLLVGEIKDFAGGR